VALRLLFAFPATKRSFRVDRARFFFRRPQTWSRGAERNPHFLYAHPLALPRALAFRLQFHADWTSEPPSEMLLIARAPFDWLDISGLLFLLALATPPSHSRNSQTLSSSLPIGLSAPRRPPRCLSTKTRPALCRQHQNSLADRVYLIDHTSTSA